MRWMGSLRLVYGEVKRAMRYMEKVNLLYREVDESNEAYEKEAWCMEKWMGVEKLRERESMWHVSSTHVQVGPIHKRSKYPHDTKLHNNLITTTLKNKNVNKIINKIKKILENAL